MPTAPDFDNVRLGGPDGIRYPLEVGRSSFVVGKEVDLVFTGLASPLTLSPQQLGNYFTFASASGAFTVSFPYGSASKLFLVANHSGQTVTVNIAAGPGGSPAASTGVAVATGFRQLLCIDHALGDVRPSCSGDRVLICPAEEKAAARSGGSAGHASNAASFQDDEDTMYRLRRNFTEWAGGRRKKTPYPKSNMPAAKKM